MTTPLPLATRLTSILERSLKQLTGAANALSGGVEALHETVEALNDINVRRR